MNAGSEGVPENGHGRGHQGEKAASCGLQGVDVDSSCSLLDSSNDTSQGQDSDTTDEDRNSEENNNDEDGGDGDGARPNKDDVPMSAAGTSQVVERVATGGLNTRSFRKGPRLPLKVSHNISRDIH